MGDPIASITREQVTTVILSTFGFSPKNEQVDAIMTLAQDQKVSRNQVEGKGKGKVG